MKNPFSLTKLLYGLACFIGLVLLCFEIYLYRNTFISWTIPFITFLISGLIAFFIDKARYQRTYNNPGWFFALFQNLFSWGSLACFLFMAGNFYLASPAASNYRLAIADRSSINGGGGNHYNQIPTVYINYFGLSKELVTNGLKKDSIDKADSVSITTKRGLLGFDIIVKYQLIH